MTRQEIISKYMIKPQFILNTCFAYYLEMHNNGHFDSVLSFLKNGDSVIGKQGVTYNAVKRELCIVSAVEFTDSRGEYAGTHYTYSYNGFVVDNSTSYSLFN